MTADTCYHALVGSHQRGEWVDCLILARALRNWLTKVGNPRLRDWEERLPVLAEIENDAKRRTTETTTPPTATPPPLQGNERAQSL